jgi:hypothetical protein
MSALINTRLRGWVAAIIPPENWRVAVIIMSGVAVGLGLLIFRVSNAASYLSNDPRTCVNPLVGQRSR